MSRAPGRTRAVFDCNTLIQAIAFDSSPAAEALRLGESGMFELFISKPALREIRRVLTYRDVQAISHNMTPVRIAGFIERVRYRATLIHRVPSKFDFPRDPKDEPYLDLVAAARADYLVTRDRDLLWLMIGHTPICKRFRQMTHPLRVIDPEGFLDAIGQPWKRSPKGWRSE